MLAARGEQVLGRSIVWASDRFADEAELPPGNHFLDARYVIKQMVNFHVSYLSLLNVSHREVEVPLNISMEENFELT